MHIESFVAQSPHVDMVWKLEHNKITLAVKRNGRTEELVRCCLLCDFKVGLSASASHHRICQAFVDSAVHERTARHLFQKFRSGDLSLCDRAQTGQPQVLDDEALQAAIEEDSSQTCGELARKFNTSSETVRLHLHHLAHPNSIESLPVTRSGSCRAHPSVPNIGCPPRILHPRKIILCVWWTCRQVTHSELLTTGQAITADLYSQLLERVQQTLHQKESTLFNRNGVPLLHDNARPHFTRVTRNTIQRLGWDNLCHPPYSSDHSPSYYHFFHSLDNHLRGKSFLSRADMHQALTDFFASHTSEFYRKGVGKKVLEADGNYFFED
ncbi:histone-lysine N-methyltransferase SETMAR [Trichonephila clavipes]|nr:histone-lysine N-methyltransferase SETMAR [Trichonephila clavipes]